MLTLVDTGLQLTEVSATKSVSVLLVLSSKESAQGKKQIDAAVAAGVHTFVWMGLPDHDKLNGGKHPIPT